MNLSKRAMRICIVFGSICLFQGMYSHSSVSREEKPLLEEEKKRKIFRKECLNPLNGSHSHIILKTKERLYFPKTFKHIETRFAITGDTVKVSMKFSSKNKYKKISTYYISATILRKNCTKVLTLWE